MTVKFGRSAFFLLLVLEHALCQSIWTLRNSGTTKNLNSVLWAGNQLVAVGEGSTIITSSDGVNWTVRNGGTTRTLLTVTWTGERYAATGNDSIRFSDDGIIWMAHFGGGSNSLIWDGNQFMGAAKTIGIIASPDGITWHGKASTFNEPLSLAWSGQNYVAMGRDGEVITSSDGDSWTRLFLGSSTIRSVTWTGSLASGGLGQFVAVSDGGSLISSNGINWKGYQWNTWLNAIAWAGPAGSGSGQLIGVGDFGTIRTSPDGINWTTRNSGTSYVLNSVTWTGSLFVAVGQDGIILTSPQDPSSIAPRLPGQESISIRFTPTQLFADIPRHFDPDVRAAIYTLSGGRIIEARGRRSSREFGVPMSVIPPGAYVLELSDNNNRLVQGFRR